MTNALVVRLVSDGVTLNLNDGTNYSVETDFVPPVTQYNLLTTMGTSTNRYDGASVYDKQAQNRQWQFGIRLNGSTAGQNRLLLGRLRAMLNRASGARPLFIETKAGADIPDPTYGQSGSPLRFEIVRGEIIYTDLYGQQPVRDGQRYPNCNIRLQIKPFALGVETELGKAEGTIFYYPIGTRPALGVSAATTNLFTNPIFGHATPTTGWSLAAGGVVSYDVALFGGDNNKVAYKGYTGTLTQALTLPIQTHALSCYAKRPDGGAVTTDDAQLYYNGSTLATTNYEDVGDGWYRLTGTLTGTGGAANTGVQFNGTCVVDGFQVEQVEHPRMLVHGDMIGCSWSGTAHASSSTSTTPKVRFPADVLRKDEGTVRVVIRPTWDATSKAGGNYRVWDNGDLDMYYNATTDRFNLADGTDSAFSAVQSFSAGDIIVIHATWSDNGLSLFVNGTQGTDGAYTLGTYNTDLYVGTTDLGAAAIDAWFLDLAIFDTALTDAQVSSDYADISNATADGEALSSIPLVWTNDGDNIIDNCLDSASSDWHYAWITGIPGDAPAVTKLLVDVSGAGDPTFTDLFMSLFDCDDHYDPAELVFKDESGTVDASRCGGEYLAATNAGPLGGIMGDITIGSRGLAQYAGRTVHGIGPLYIPTFTTAIKTDINDVLSENGEFPDTANFDLTLGGGIVAPPIDVLARNEDIYGFVPKITSDTPPATTQYRIDFHAYFVDPLLRVNGITARFALDSVNNIANEMSSDTLTGSLATIGDKIEFVPHRWNLLQILMRDSTTRLHDKSDTATLTEVRIVPRYEVAL